jgi:hypothetical protein
VAGGGIADAGYGAVELAVADGAVVAPGALVYESDDFVPFDFPEHFPGHGSSAEGRFADADLIAMSDEEHFIKEGMLAASFVAVFLIPAGYCLVESLGSRRRRPSNPS